MMSKFKKLQDILEPIDAILAHGNVSVVRIRKDDFDFLISDLPPYARPSAIKDGIERKHGKILNLGR